MKTYIVTFTQNKFAFHKKLDKEYRRFYHSRITVSDITELYKVVSEIINGESWRYYFRELVAIEEG